MIFDLSSFLPTAGPVALLVAMGIIFAETGLLVGFFLPGDSLLFTIGVLAAGGLLHLPIWVAALGLLVAAMLGDQLGYALGRHFGPRVFRRPESRFFASSHAERAHRFFDRYGAKAVVLARFVPVVRTFTPVVAGVAAMPRRRFTLYNALGAALWTTGLLAVGYFLGSVPVIATHIGVIAIGLVALSLLPASAGLLRYRRHKPDPGAVSGRSWPLLGAAASSDRPAR